MNAESVPLPPDSSWRGVIIYAIITGIALSSEYLRRIMPPPRKRRREHDEDEDTSSSEDEKE